MGNSNAFDYDVYTEWAPGFVSLLLYLFDFVNIDFVCCFREMLPSMCSVSLYSEGRRHTHTHTQPIRLESLNRHNVSKQCEAAVQRQRHLQYSTVRSGHRSSSLLHNHSLNTSKNKKKTGTENVNTTKKGNVIF